MKIHYPIISGVYRRFFFWKSQKAARRQRVKCLSCHQVQTFKKSCSRTLGLGNFGKGLPLFCSRLAYVRCIIQQWSAALVLITDWRSNFFGLRFRSCSKIFEAGSGPENLSNLKIRPLFRLRPRSTQPHFTNVFY